MREGQGRSRSLRSVSDEGFAARASAGVLAGHIEEVVEYVEEVAPWLLPEEKAALFAVARQQVRPLSLRSPCNFLRHGTPQVDDG